MLNEPYHTSWIIESRLFGIIEDWALNDSYKEQALFQDWFYKLRHVSHALT